MNTGVDVVDGMLPKPATTASEIMLELIGAQRFAFITQQHAVLL